MNAPFAINDLEIHLWAFTIGPVDSVAMQFRPLLSLEEEERASRFKFAHLSNAYAICHGLVRLLLSRYLGTDPKCIHFHYQLKGKPVLANCNGLTFNLSHTDGLMICGVTRACEIGVDVEKLRPLPDMLEVANSFFCPEETDELLSLPRDQRTLAFYCCWTRKEAYIKALGEGLSAPLHSFRVTLDPTEVARFVHIQGNQDIGQSWILSAVKLGEPYIAAIAYPGPERIIRVTRNVDPLDFLGD